MLRGRGDRGGVLQHGAGGAVYQMRQRMFSIGDDYWIETNSGQRAFKVDGKALRVRKTLILESPGGQELYKIQEKLVTIRETMDIEGPAGPVATVRKAMITPLRERFTVQLASGGEWNVQGNITDHEYEISGPQGKVAEVGKRWFRVADTYGIEVAPGQDDPLVVAVAIVIDSMTHPAR
jgi:uncharacterized protein YxjI